uniref:Uncharacterized protein n=1 Tax=Schistocephalus solidus TaxID=70667 RepID=A0A0X3Q276_SCHSO
MQARLTLAKTAAPQRYVKICGCLVLHLVSQWMNLEAVQSRDKVFWCPLGAIFWVHKKEHVWEASSKIGPIRVMMPSRFGCINVLAAWTVDLNHGLARHIRKTNWQTGLVLTVDPWTVAEVTLQPLLAHQHNAPIREDVTSVDEAIEHFRGLFYDVGFTGIVVQLVIRLEIENHVKGLAVVWDLFAQARQIKAILYILLIDFAEELVSAQSAEPQDPRNLLTAAHGKPHPDGTQAETKARKI